MSSPIWFDTKNEGQFIVHFTYQGIKLKIKRNDWLLVDTCPQAANHRALF